MTDLSTTDPAAQPAVGSLGEAIACERCGEHPGRYVVSDVVERDTSFFCGSCLVLTYAQVASDMIAAEAGQ
jgi:uncharacterized protein YuzB (UPF0349 family)